jgi:GNAT superfamily N-acetyltransferase
MIHLAELSDRPHFLRLWQEFLTDQRKAGSLVHDSLSNLYLELGNFESYSLGSRLGGCLFWTPEDGERPEGIVMWGESATDSKMETDIGKACFLQGVYVVEEYRKQGITKQLFAKALETGLAQGFDSVETFVLEGNDAGVGSALGFGTNCHMKYYVRKCRE